MGQLQQILDTDGYTGRFRALAEKKVAELRTAWDKKVKAS